MAFWDKWFSKKEEKHQNPKLVFEINGDDLSVMCSWERPNSDEAALELANKYALLVYMLNNGKLINHIQQAVANFESTDKVNKHVSRMVLAGIQHSLRGGTGGDDRPVVSPSDAFNVRGDND